MNLPKINLSRPSFTPRFFIYLLFGLVIMMLLVEGGYFLYPKKKIPATVLSDEFGTVVRKGVFTTWTSADKTQKFTTITGQVKRIEGRTLFVANLEKPTSKNDLVKVILSEDVNIDVQEGEFSPDNPKEALIMLSPEGVHGDKIVKGDLNEIPVGSVIIAVDVEKVKDSFLTQNDILVAKPR